MNLQELLHDRRGVYLDAIQVELGQKWQDAAVSGDWYHVEFGPFTFTRETFESWVANAAHYGKRLKVDYDHNSLIPGAPPEVNRASGHFTPDAMRIVQKNIPGLGLRWVFQIAPTWTPDATKFIEDGEYWGLSVVAFPDWPSPFGHEGESMGDFLFNVALTSEPFMTGMEPVAASLNPHRANKDKDMNEKEIRAALGIGDDANILDAIGDLKTKADGTDAVMAKVDEMTATVAEVGPVLDAMKANDLDATGVVALMSGKPDTEMVALRTRLSQVEADLKAEREDRESAERARYEADRSAAVETLIAAGQLPPAKRDVAESMFDQGAEKFASFVDVLPPARKLTATPSTAGAEPASGSLEEEIAEDVKKALSDGAESLVSAVGIVCRGSSSIRERWESARRRGEFSMEKVDEAVKALA